MAVILSSCVPRTTRFHVSALPGWRADAAATGAVRPGADTMASSSHVPGRSSEGQSCNAPSPCGSSSATASFSSRGFPFCAVKRLGDVTGCSARPRCAMVSSCICNSAYPRGNGQPAGDGCEDAWVAQGRGRRPHLITSKSCRRSTCKSSSTVRGRSSDSSVCGRMTARSASQLKKRQVKFSRRIRQSGSTPHGDLHQSLA